MDIMQTGVQLLQNKLGLGDAQSGNLLTALSTLMGNGKGIDITALISKMQGSGGLASMAMSWLGDGANETMSGGQISELFGSDKVAAFASKLNIDRDTAVNGLADVLPQMVDKASSAGSLLDSAGGIGGLMGMASKFMK